MVAASAALIARLQEKTYFLFRPVDTTVEVRGLLSTRRETPPTVQAVFSRELWDRQLFSRLTPLLRALEQETRGRISASQILQTLQEYRKYRFYPFVIPPKNWPENLGLSAEQRERLMAVYQASRIPEHEATIRRLLSHAIDVAREQNQQTIQTLETTADILANTAGTGASVLTGGVSDFIIYYRVIGDFLRRRFSELQTQVNQLAQRYQETKDPHIEAFFKHPSATVIVELSRLLGSVFGAPKITHPVLEQLRPKISLISALNHPEVRNVVQQKETTTALQMFWSEINAGYIRTIQSLYAAPMNGLGSTNENESSIRDRLSRFLSVFGPISDILAPGIRASSSFLSAMLNPIRMRAILPFIGIVTALGLLTGLLAARLHVQVLTGTVVQIKQQAENAQKQAIQKGLLWAFVLGGLVFLGWMFWKRKTT